MIPYILLAVAGVSSFVRKGTKYIALASLFILSTLQLDILQFLFVFVGIIVLLIWKDPNPEDVSLVLFLLAGSVGVLSATDIFNLFVFFEIALVASYFLLFEQSRKDIRALSRYLFLSSIGTSFILISISIIWAETGSLAFSVISTSPLAFIFLISGFGVKMGVVPFHMWVSRVYSTAPIPIVVLLSAVLSKAGAAGFMVTFPIFISNSWAVIALALISMTAANLSALSESDLKKILAYSSIANLSYILLAVGAGGDRAATFHMINHSLSFTCAFIAIGIVAKRFGTSNVQKLKGAASSNRILALAILVSIFSLASLPPLPIFVSEFYILSSVISSPLIAGVFVFNLLLSGAYYVNIVRLLEIGTVKKRLRLRKAEAAVLIALVVIIIATGLAPSLILSRV
jgi:formate hydrogenlyase subunit 3/multisubunit Na+/H+ antiporter MnhD subunit